MDRTHSSSDPSVAADDVATVSDPELVSVGLTTQQSATPHLGVVRRYLPSTLLPMIISVLIASAVIGLLLVVLVQGKWTSLDRWFVAVLGWAVMAMVIGQYVNQLDLVGLW